MGNLVGWDVKSVICEFKKNRHKVDALVKSHIFIISEEIRIESLRIVISVSYVRSVVNCTFYMGVKVTSCIFQNLPD